MLFIEVLADEKLINIGNQLQVLFIYVSILIPKLEAEAPFFFVLICRNRFGWLRCDLKQCFDMSIRILETVDFNSFNFFVYGAENAIEHDLAPGLIRIKKINKMRRHKLPLGCKQIIFYMT